MLPDLTKRTQIKNKQRIEDNFTVKPIKLEK